MKTMSIKDLFKAAFVVLFLTSTAHADLSVVLPSDAAKICSFDQEAFESEWVKLRFPEKSLANAVLNGQPVGPVYDQTSGMVYVFPPNGPNFPNTHADNTTMKNANCSFFKWSSQMFLWLTSTVTDQLCSSAQNCAKNELPGKDPSYVFASEFFYRLKEGASLVPQGAGMKKTAQTRHAKTDHEDDTVAQAGSNGVLFLKPAEGALSNGTESLVYYSVHTNRPYGYVRAENLNQPKSSLFKEFPADHKSICQALQYGLKNGYAPTLGEQGVLNKLFFFSYCADIVDKSQGRKLGSILEQIISENLEFEDVKLGEVLEQIRSGNSKLQDVELGAILKDISSGEREQILQFRKIIQGRGGVTIPSLEMAIDYLSMAMELKASWVPAWTLSDTSGYLLSEAYLPTYKNLPGGSLVQNGDMKSTVALVGMHVVGTVKGHPEMIWATFEHYNNAPNTAYAYLDQNQNTKIHADRLQSKSQDWLFSNGSLAGVNAKYATFAAPNSGFGKMPMIKPIFKIDSNEKLKNSTTNVLRLSPWGSSARLEKAPRINSEMISTNLSVLNNLKTFYSNEGVNASKDPRLNYILTGSSWGVDGKFPTYSDNPPTKNIAGTAAMENATLETFTQTSGHQMNATGCFSCHAVQGKNEKQPGWKFGVSHIFGSIKSVSGKIIDR